jgi:hypothetical protein
MPRYEVVGFGRETGRKRVRIYEAKNKEDVIMMAASEGTIVDMSKIRILPESPATERQLEYAKNLGIKIPKDATKSEMTKLISQAVEKEMTNKDDDREGTVVKEITNEDGSIEGYSFRLGDFYISFSSKRLTVGGPDEQIKSIIGKRFLEHIKTQEFQKILSDFLTGEEPNQINNAESKLIKILGIPPKTLP